MIDLGRRMATGALWMIGLRFVTRIIGVGSTLVLARLLVPEDFGLVALATTFAALLEVASEFNFDIALIRNQKATAADYDTAWTLGIGKALLIALLLVLVAGPAAGFFGDARLEPIFWCLAVASILQGCWNIYTADFRKHLQLEREFRFQVWGKLGQVLFAVVGAIIFQSYWALIAGIVFRRLIMLWLSFVMVEQRPHLSVASWRELVHFSKWILLNNGLTFVRERIDSLVVGKLAGAEALGFYAIAQEIADLPTTELAGPVNKAVFPGYARIADDRARLADGYIDALAAMLLVCLPAAVGIGLVAEPAIELLLGQRWLPAVPLIHALMVYGVLRTGAANASAVYLAMGRVRIEPFQLAVYLVVLVPLLLWLVREHGGLGAALALAAAAAVNLVLTLTIVTRLLHISWMRLLASAWRTLVATAVMAAAVALLPVPINNPVLTLLMDAIIGAAAFTACLLGLWHLAGRPRGPEENVLRFARGQFLALRNPRVAESP